MTGADQIRRAASGLRAKAEGATSGPWVRSGTSIETDHECSSQHGCWPVADTYSGRAPDGTRQPLDTTRADAEYIAAMHPAVGLAVADWLDDLYERITSADYDEDDDLAAALRGEADVTDWPEVHRALAVARAFLGES